MNATGLLTTGILHNQGTLGEGRGGRLTLPWAEDEEEGKGGRLHLSWNGGE